MCRLILFVNFVRGRENFGRFDKNQDNRSCVTKILCFCRLPQRCFFFTERVFSTLDPGYWL